MTSVSVFGGVKTGARGRREETTRFSLLSAIRFFSSDVRPYRSQIVYLRLTFVRVQIASTQNRQLSYRIGTSFQSTREKKWPRQDARPRSSSSKSILPSKISTPKIDFSMKTNQQKFLFFSVYGDRHRLGSSSPVETFGKLMMSLPAMGITERSFSQFKEIYAVFLLVGALGKWCGVLVTKATSCFASGAAILWHTLCYLPQGMAFDGQCGLSFGHIHLLQVLDR